MPVGLVDTRLQTPLVAMTFEIVNRVTSNTIAAFDNPRDALEAYRLIPIADRLRYATAVFDDDGHAITLDAE